MCAVTILVGRGSPEMQQVRLLVRFSLERLRFSLCTHTYVLLYSDTVRCPSDNSIKLGRTDASQPENILWFSVYCENVGTGRATGCLSEDVHLRPLYDVFGSEAHATATSNTKGKSVGLTFGVNNISATQKAPTSVPAPSPTVKAAFSLPSSQLTFAKLNAGFTVGLGAGTDVGAFGVAETVLTPKVNPTDFPFVVEVAVAWASEPKTS